MSTEAINTPTGNFLRTIVSDDLQRSKHQTVVTRFPPDTVYTE